MNVQVDLTNTPGIYYVISYFLSSCLYIAVNPKRLDKRRQVLVQIAFLLALGLFMIWTDGVEVQYYIPCVLFEVFLVWLSLYLCCDMDWKRTTYFCARAMILGEFAASLEWQLFYYGLAHGFMELNMGWNLLVLSLTHGSVFAVMYWLECKYKDGNTSLHISGKEIWVSVLIAVMVYTISNMSYAITVSPFSSRFPAEIFIIRTLADLGGVGMLFAYHMQLQMIATRLEKDYFQQMLQLQYENYRMSAESIDIVNQKYHDLKHQIEILRRTESTEEKNAYLDKMEAEIKAYESQNKTGNRVLDIILTTKSLQCQKQGINLTCVAEGSELEFMHPMDISALFGNALDNAIESVLKIPDPDKRLIHVSVVRQKTFLRIRIENCFEGELRFENGIPLTSKTDQGLHGYGTKSIRNITERYNGSMTIDTKGNWFELRILIPLQK